MRIKTIDLTSSHLSKVKALGAANSSTLGFLPEGAFDEHARKQQIIAAIDSAEECVAYLLYRISRERAIIVHLCVSGAARRKGMASKLVDYLKAEVKDLRGIGLRCRRDYGASHLWPKLNFVALEETTGRGRIPTTLTFWWFDNGHPTLFTDSILEVKKSKTCVILDANVFFDLNDPHRLGHEESKSLLADWLSDSIEVCVSDEILNEINRNPDKALRRHERESYAHFTTLPCDSYILDSVTQELKQILTKRLSLQDESDHRQLARTIASNAQVFVTRDQELLDLSEQLFESYGITVLRPADLVIKLDEVLRTTEYLPQRLAGTLTQLQLVQSGQEAYLTEKFRAQSLGESRQAFQQTLRQILSKPQSTRCYKVLDLGSEPMALCAYVTREEGVLEIPLLRVRPYRLAITLARQLAFRGVTQLRNKGVSVTRITDPYFDQAIATSITNDGFVSTSEGSFKINVNLQTSASMLVKSLSELGDLSSTGASYRDGLIKSLQDPTSIESSEVLSRIEHLLWPFKIRNGNVPTFIVPIRPEWAKDLFDENLASETLYGSKEELGLSRENVYYRSKHASGGIKAPGRILWYVSGDKRFSGSSSIRACSRLTRVVVDKPKELFRSFKRLGVYEWKDIFDIAKQNIDNEIMALIFGDTELFDHPIYLPELRKILQSHGCRTQLQSPTAISSEIFEALYRP
jgi:predicted nucleic acid-binding protein/GNAT superfamily N-acetyltransferase